MVVAVKLVDTDTVHGFIDFEYTPGVTTAKVERAERKRRAAQALRDRVGETFRAVVTGVSQRATWVRTVPELIEGRLVRGRRMLAEGDEIDVVLLSVDPARGFIDFARGDAVVPAE